ncbi:DUF3180 domain-containing protein [Mycobacterium sp. MYCO198283]|uniref:DUF3180 domain-containing protein n=1 Tax=Mycobacterium sp. MYCO198283 TaxID=2883505 RepID=UPI001E53C12A|nr:DUF3180 domain-containing protein [Mycobacterium sp. MYCO198283]MCG5431454.1 DUF3180 domain-containing protein [Mycobacterium sp. MYCO198283]
MGPTRKRDLLAAALAVAVLSYLVVLAVYDDAFPAVTAFTGLSLLVLAVAEALWGRFVRAKIAAAEIGPGRGRLHPLAVARTVIAAKASAWAGAVMTGWWVGVLAYLIPRRDALRVAAADTPGAVVALCCAAALTVAALWLQHCCESPGEPPAEPD